MAKNLNQLNGAADAQDDDITLLQKNGTDYKVTIGKIRATCEPTITKNTAFNKNFGTVAGTVAEGNHNHDTAYVDISGDVMTGTLTVTKILPDMTGASGAISVRDIGDETHKFANVWADEVHVGASSLYVNGKQVISDNSDIMTFATDLDQGVNLKTSSSVHGTGNGNLQLTSDNQIGLTAKGGIDMTVSTVASKNITITNSSSNGNIILNSASQIQFTAPTVSTGNLTITGNLSVSGTTTTVNTEQLNIQDNLITLNSNQTGTPNPVLTCGIDVERGDENNYRFLFEELTDTFRIGMVGQLQAVATREDSPTNGGVVTWDSATTKFITSVKKTAFNLDLGTSAGTVAEGDHSHALLGSVQFSSVPTLSSGARVVTCGSGTAFPGSPGFADEFYRTDLDEWYKYNGAVWTQI